MAVKAFLNNRINCDLHGYVRIPKNMFSDNLYETKYCPACAIEAGYDIGVLEYAEEDFDLYNSITYISDDAGTNLLWNGTRNELLVDTEDN